MENSPQQPPPPPNVSENLKMPRHRDEYEVAAAVFLVLVLILFLFCFFHLQSQSVVRINSKTRTIDKSDTQIALLTKAEPLFAKSIQVSFVGLDCLLETHLVFMFVRQIFLIYWVFASQ